MFNLDKEQKKSFEGIFKKLDAKLSKTSVKSFNKLPYTTKEGVQDNWTGVCIGMWTNGFWPALMVLMYSVTKKDEYLKTARNACKLLDEAILKPEVLNHDVGFMWNISSGADFRITADNTQKNRFLAAANYMMSRYVPDGDFLLAWNMEEAKGWAIIDCMMNLPVLYRATELTGDDRYKKIAVRHAEKTKKFHLKEDGSCYHIVEYNTDNGEFVKSHRGQGMSETSSWTRGQAWGIYGFALSYKFTKNKEYLDTAVKIADYYIKKFDKWGYVAPADFCQPKTPEIFDTTAGVIAACGFLEIASYLDDSEAKKYIDAAINIILDTEKRFCNWDDNEDSILQYGTEAYIRAVHIPIIYGDYFFTEAVCRLLGYNVDFIW